MKSKIKNSKNDIEDDNLKEQNKSFEEIDLQKVKKNEMVLFYALIQL